MPDLDILPESYQSVGFMAQGYQLDVASIQTAISLLEIQADYYQNGVAFYGDDARMKLLRHLNDANMLHQVRG